MRWYKRFTFLIIFALLSSATVYAQYDDVYYDPEKDGGYYDYSDDRQNTSDEGYYSESDYDTYAYDNDEYDYYNDYDFYYTSRIRRFHRPLYGFGYYDPVYVDSYYYDPFLAGPSMLIYDDFYAARGFTRFRGWNRWGYPAPRIGGVNFNFFVNSGLGAGGFYNPWFRGGFNPFFRGGFNRFGFGGFGGFGFNTLVGPRFNPYGFFANYYCPPTWGGGVVYNTFNDVNNNVYYGPRTGGNRTGAIRTGDNRSRTPDRKRVGENTMPRGRTGVAEGLGDDRARTIDRGRTINPQTGRTIPNSRRIEDRRAINTERLPQRATERTNLDRYRRSTPARRYQPGTERSTRRVDPSNTRSTRRSYTPSNSRRSPRSRGSSINRSSRSRGSSINRSSGNRSSRGSSVNRSRSRSSSSARSSRSSGSSSSRSSSGGGRSRGGGGQ